MKEKRKSSRWEEVSLLLVAPSRSDPATGVLVSAAYRRRARGEADEEIKPRKGFAGRIRESIR